MKFGNDQRNKNDHLIEAVKESSIAPIKSEDMMMLDRQGRCSQQLRCSLLHNMGVESESNIYPSTEECVVGNIMKNSQTVVRNKADIGCSKYFGSNKVSMFPDSICSLSLIPNKETNDVDNGRNERKTSEVCHMIE